MIKSLITSLSIVCAVLYGTTPAMGEISLGEATGAPSLVWTTGGDGTWYGQTDNTSEGSSSAAQSNSLTSNQTSWLATSIEGPCLLSFMWSASFGPVSGSLSFQTSTTGDPLGDWKIVDNISVYQSNGWTNYNYVHAGTSTLYIRWFIHAGSDSPVGMAADDHGWLDSVKVTPLTLTSLAEASDFAEGDWATSTNNPWIGQSAMSYDGESALMSPTLQNLQNNTESTLDMTLSGPANLSFIWRATDGLLPAFYVEYQASDASAFTTIKQLTQTDPTQWKSETLYVPASGTATVRFHTRFPIPSFPGSVYSGIYLIDTVSVTPAAEITLEDALDLDGQPWTTSSPGFFGENYFSKDNVDGAYSGTLTSGTSVYLETTVTGPRFIHLDLYNSSAQMSTNSIQLKATDGAAFSTIGTSQQFGSSQAWENDTVFIPLGDYTFRWVTSATSSPIALYAEGIYLDNFSQDELLKTTDLGNALDNKSLVWESTNHGVYTWTGMEVEGAIGTYAAGALAVSGYESNIRYKPELRTTVQGPCLLTFRWNITSTPVQNQGPPSYPNMTLDMRNANLTDAEFSTVMTAGNITTWTTQTLQIPAGQQVLRWTISPGSSYNQYKPALGWIDQVEVTSLSALSIADAVDLPMFSFNSGPENYQWYGQVSDSHDGMDAAISPLVTAINGYGTNSWIETELEGPGVLNYYWKQSANTMLSFQLARKQVINTNFITQNSLNFSNAWTAASTFIPDGRYMVRWNVNSSYEPGICALDQITYSRRDPISLHEALDAPFMTWYSGPESLAWIGQNLDQNDTVDAAMAPPLGQNEKSYVETAVTGPGTMNYAIKLNLNGGGTRLNLYLGTPVGNNIDWELMETMEYSTYWIKKSQTIPAGFHYVAWQFERNSSALNQNSAYAYLDEVDFRPAGMWQYADAYGLGSLRTNWFGIFNAYTGGWINHQEHGWLYADGNPTTSLWLYAPDMGWLWTNSSTYPFLFRFNDGTWIYYMKDSVSPRYIYNFNAGEWELH